MATNCFNHKRAPRVIRGANDAIAALGIATYDGTADVVAVACVDSRMRPLTMLIVDDCPAGAGEVAASFRVLVDAIDGSGTDVYAVFLGASRPGRSVSPGPEDLEMFEELAALADEAGVVLLDWFICADGKVASVAEEAGGLMW